MKNAVFGSARTLCALLLALCLLLSAVSCAQTDAFSGTNEKFFRMVLNRLERDEVRIYTVDAYKMDNWYYYCVDYTYVSPVDGEWTRLELVYFGAWEIDSYFNPNWEDFGDMADRRDAYLEAVRNGEHKQFTEEEIQRYVDEFYKTQ